MKVRNRVESEASKDAEMGMKAGILGPDPGFNPGKGSMNITESVTSPFFGNDVAPKQTWVENSNESSNNERRMCLKKISYKFRESSFHITVISQGKA